MNLPRVVKSHVLAAAACASLIAPEKSTPPSDSIHSDAVQRLRAAAQEYRSVAGGASLDAQTTNPAHYCVNNIDQTRCYDTKGGVVRQVKNEATRTDKYLWKSKTANKGHVVYQPKDDGRVFFTQWTGSGVLYWIVFDPTGRDLPGWLKGHGFSEVGSYNANFAYAGRIQDVQKRRDFWIWVQARDYEMKEFEKKCPHLAATVAPKE